MESSVRRIFFLSIIISILSICFCDNMYDDTVLYDSDIDVNSVNNITDSENLTIYKKCCPLNQGISRLKTNQSSVYYECIDAIDENENIIFNTTLKYPLASLKVIKPQSEVIIGFPTACDVEEYSESRIDSIDSIPSDSCIDKIFGEASQDSETTAGDGSLIVLSCNTFVRFGLFNIPRFRSISKCCVGDMVFDTDSNTCVQGNSSDDFFSSLIDLFPKDFDILNLKYGLPPCDTPNVMFRYTSKKYKFQFQGSNLKLKGENSKEIFFREGTFCVDQNLEGDLVARSCKSDCDDGICITKCCPEGQVYMYPNNVCGSRSRCGLNPEWGFSPTYHNITNLLNPVRAEPPDVLGIRYKDSCPLEKYILNPGNPHDISYVDVGTGDIIMPGTPNPFGRDFCMEIVDSPCPNRPKTLYYFICFPVPVEKKEVVKMKISSVGFVISSAFLAATFMVYLFLPALQNRHGRILMCYVAAMLVGYSCLARVQWPVYAGTLHCKALGYAVFFSFMVAFSWLNIMCFDIWLTFGNTRSIQLTKQNMKDLKKLILFSLYAFGFPMLLTLVVFVLDEYDVMVGVLDANMGKSQCWFNTEIHRRPFLILFILPAGIQIACNIILFTLTAIHCNKVKSEIHRMQSSSMGERCKRRFMADKAMFIMNMKLFIVMGVTWTMEIISAFDTEMLELWYIADFINALQGVPIFCILVLKRKVYRLLRKRLGLGVRTRNDTSGVTSSMAISRTSCSEVIAKKHLAGT